MSPRLLVWRVGDQLRARGYKFLFCAIDKRRRKASKRSRVGVFENEKRTRRKNERGGVGHELFFCRRSLTASGPILTPRNNHRSAERTYTDAILLWYMIILPGKPGMLYFQSPHFPRPEASCGLPSASLAAFADDSHRWHATLPRHPCDRA